MTRILLTLAFLLILPARATLEWQDCRQPPFSFLEWADAPQQCAQLVVPLAYDNDNRSARRHDPRTLTLALSKVPASGERLGSVIFINGGPGQASVEPYLQNDGLEALREHFDLISYDPRGVGFSTPGIRCHDAGEETPSSARAFVAACQKHTPAYLLPHIGSDEATNDVEQIRLALGDDSINLIAYSYGTKIASLYALRFPQNLRAAVLDGVVDIFESDFSVRLHQEKGHQQAYQAFRQYCLQKPGCPLAAYPADSNAGLRALITQSERLRAREQRENRRWQNFLANSTSHLGSFLTATFTGEYQPAESADSIIPDTDAILAALHSNLVWPDYWEDLDFAMRELMLGEPLYFYFLSFMQTNLNDALGAITCADTARPMTDGETRILQRYIANASPYDNDDLLDPESLLDPCAIWPHLGGDHRLHLPAEPPPHTPLLLMAQRHDPATPWHNAQRMADYWQSPLITRDGHGHTFLFAGISACMDDIALAYLQDPTQPPAKNTCTTEEP